MAKAKSRSKAKKKSPKKRMKAKARPKAKAKRKAKKVKAKARPKAKAKPKAAKPKTKRKPNAAFMKPLTPDAALAAIVGSDPLPRTEITKRLWVYIKKNGLQDPVNKRNINADEALKRVFGGRSSVSMFEMTKLVSNHLS